MLCVKWSPEQISNHLAAVFHGRQEMTVSPERIYQALYVQGRGHLRADLHQHLGWGVDGLPACFSQEPSVQSGAEGVRIAANTR